MYTKVNVLNTSEILISKPLKHFEELLDTIPMFYRPHRSYLINLKYIKEYYKKDGGYIIMDNNESVSISKDKKEEFLTIVQNIG
jgi:two-component system LytT family response regulator